MGATVGTVYSGVIMGTVSMSYSGVIMGATVGTAAGVITGDKRKLLNLRNERYVTGQDF